mgnify:FL=1
MLNTSGMVDYFNPRSRKGSDLQLNNLLLRNAVISIHAPARGATRPGLFQYRPVSDFNPRSRKGSDPIGLYALIGIMLFQSTLPQGERHHNRNH